MKKCQEHFVGMRSAGPHPSSSRTLVSSNWSTIWPIYASLPGHGNIRVHPLLLFLVFITGRMDPGGSDGGQKTLKISSDNNFPRRLLSKETSAAVSSIRGYDGVSAAAVPFVWESCPGTPKHPIGAAGGGGGVAILPPLNPPPSYQRNPGRMVRRKQAYWPHLLGDVLPRLFSRRKRRSPPSS